jgi:hypothetical protein
MAILQKLVLGVALLLALALVAVCFSGAAPRWLSPYPDDWTLDRDARAFEAGIAVGLTTDQLLALCRTSEVDRWNEAAKGLPAPHGPYTYHLYFPPSRWNTQHEETISAGNIGGNRYIIHVDASDRVTQVERASYLH